MFTFETKIKKFDLNSDLKRRTWLEEQVLVYIIWAGNVMILDIPESTKICPNVAKYASTCVTLWICLNMRETLRA